MSQQSSLEAQPDREQARQAGASSSNIPQLIALLGSIVMAITMVGTLIFGVWSYQRNAAAQVQLLALNSLQHYLDLAVARPELASRSDDEPVDARYAWFAAEAMTTAQTLWLLVGQQPDWQRSIDAIIRQHRSYLRSGAFQCDDFAIAFVDYLRARVPPLECAASKAP